MLYELVGGATAAAGGYLLRVGFRNTRQQTRTIETGNVSGSILSTGDTHGNSVQTVGFPPAQQPAVQPAQPSVRAAKPRSISITIGWVLIGVGIAIAGFGIYWDWIVVKS